MELIYYFILILGWIIGNIIFNNFEKHLPFYRRIIKLVFIITLFFVVDLIFGKVGFYVLIGLFFLGIFILHFWWLPKNGIIADQLIFLVD